MAMTRSGFVLSGLLALTVAACDGSCSTTPRPTITIGQETRRLNGPPTVRATIVPNQFPVTDVILEFGRRPSTANAVAIQHNSTASSYNLARILSDALPRTQAFDVSFRFFEGGPNAFSVGEVIDYQFKVTHLNADNQPLFFWSERRTLVVEPRVNAPPGGGGGGAGGGGGGCQDTLALVSDSGAGGGASAGVVSADGAFVAFVTSAALDSNDTNGAEDVYRREVASGNVVRVSGLSSVTNDLGGNQPAISSDGRFVAFTSRSNFDPQDTNGLGDVYRRDVGATGAGAFVRISGLSSVSNDRGGSQPAISSDGRFVAFTSRSNFDTQDTNDADDVYRRDAGGTNAGAFVRASGLSSVSDDRGGTQPAISGDGRFVAFTSRSNFAAQDTNDAEDVYRRDMNGTNAGAFVRVSGLSSVSSDQGESAGHIRRWPLRRVRVAIELRCAGHKWRRGRLPARRECRQRRRVCQGERVGFGRERSRREPASHFRRRAVCRVCLAIEFRRAGHQRCGRRLSPRHGQRERERVHQDYRISVRTSRPRRPSAVHLEKRRPNGRIHLAHRL